MKTAYTRAFVACAVIAATAAAINLDNNSAESKEVAGPGISDTAVFVAGFLLGMTG